MCEAPCTHANGMAAQVRALKVARCHRFRVQHPGASKRYTGQHVTPVLGSQLRSIDCVHLGNGVACVQLDDTDVRVVGGENMMEERPTTEGLELFDTGVEVCHWLAN